MISIPLTPLGIVPTMYGAYIPPINDSRQVCKERIIIMNEKRRNLIRQALRSLENARDTILDACYEEQDALDNTPENLQCSAHYTEMEDALQTLCDAESSIVDAQKYLEYVLN